MESLRFIDKGDPEYEYVEDFHENLDRLWNDNTMFYEVLDDRIRRLKQLDVGLK